MGNKAVFALAVRDVVCRSLGALLAWSGTWLLLLRGFLHDARFGVGIVISTLIAKGCTWTAMVFRGVMTKATSQTGKETRVPFLLPFSRGGTGSRHITSVGLNTR